MKQNRWEVVLINPRTRPVPGAPAFIPLSAVGISAGMNYDQVLLLQPSLETLLLRGGKETPCDGNGTEPVSLTCR